MNQEIGEGLPLWVITSYTCVFVNKLGRPFRAGLSLADRTQGYSTWAG